MKKYLIVLLFLTLLTFSFSSSDTIVYVLKKNSTEEYSQEYGQFYFDVSDFSINDEILIQVRGNDFGISQLKGQFMNSIADYSDYILDHFEINPFKSERISSNTFRYYSIFKNSTYLKGSNGKFLYLEFQCSGTVYLKLYNKTVYLNTLYTNILKKIKR